MKTEGGVRTEGASDQIDEPADEGDAQEPEERVLGRLRLRELVVRVLASVVLLGPRVRRRPRARGLLLRVGTRAAILRRRVAPRQRCARARRVGRGGNLEVRRVVRLRGVCQRRRVQ